MNKKGTRLPALLLFTVVVMYVLSGCESGNRFDTLVQKVLPMEQAVREIEVSIWETAAAIFHYLSEPSDTALEEYTLQIRDVEVFFGKYKDLIDTDNEREMATRFEAMWNDSVSKAEELIQLRKKIIKKEEETWDSVHEVDDLIDYKLQPVLMSGTPDLLEKERAVREVEVSLWEIINAVNFYLYKHSDKAKREFPTQLEDVKEFWEKYKALEISSVEKQYVKEFEEQWRQAVILMKECISLADELREREFIFWESIHSVDDMVDFEIQEQIKLRIEKMR